MFEIDIYYNKNGELTLTQKNEEGKLMGRCHGREVKRLLATIKDEKIRKIFPKGRDTAAVIYDDACVNVHQIEEMDNEPLMQDYLRILEKKLEQQQEQNQAREHKVKRQNKYRGFVTAVGLLLFIAVAGTTLAGAAIAPEDETKDFTTNPPAIHQTGEMPSQNITNVPVFGTSTKEEVKIPETEEKFMFLEYEDRTDSEKYKTAETLYGEKIEKYANMYGLDPQLVLAIATQERGVHSDKMDPGGATGLMQIQNSIWEDAEVTAYNFVTEEYEVAKITKEGIKDVDKNIKYGCMILQSYIRGKNYNIALGVASYNMGPTNISKVLNAYVEATGISKEAVISDQTDNGWMGYRHIIPVGHQEYNEYVFSYMGDEFTTYVTKPSGERVELTVKNHTQSKVANR